MVGALVATWRKRYAPRTAYSYRGRLAKLLRTLEAFGGHHINPPKVPFPPARATVARGEELHALLTTASPWLRLFILLYLQCGLRRSEALAVTPRTWDPDQHTVTIKVKGGRTRTAQLTPDVETLLQMAAPTTTDPDQPYIYALRGRPISKSGLGQAWTALKKRCEVNPLVTAHDLRRTAATILYTATKDLRVPQQLLGHQRLSSTLTYLAPMHPDEARKYSELLRFDHFKPKEGDKPQ